MTASKIIQDLEKRQLKENLPDFRVGDTVDVGVKIIEGDKERVQVFSGTVVARHGHGLNETFTVRRIVQGEGVERVFLVHSPKLTSIEVTHRGQVRRAKLYYLRGRVGKATRIKGQRMSAKTDAAAAQPKEPAQQ